MATAERFKFEAKGGGKQGDPLYPYIFLIVMLGLMALVETREDVEGITAEPHI